MAHTVTQPSPNMPSQISMHLRQYDISRDALHNPIHLAHLSGFAFAAFGIYIYIYIHTTTTTTYLLFDPFWETLM